MYSVAKRDKGLCRERHTTDKQSEDCITYLTAVVAHECKASQQGFDVREKENSNLRCSVAEKETRDFAVSGILLTGRVKIVSNTVPQMSRVNAKLPSRRLT